MEDLAVYGYITPTRVKIIIALELADAVVRDADVITASYLCCWRALPTGLSCNVLVPRCSKPYTPPTTIRSPILSFVSTRLLRMQGVTLRLFLLWGVNLGMH